MVEMQTQITIPVSQPTQSVHIPEHNSHIPQRPYSNSPTDAQKDHNRWVEGWNQVILTCN